MPSVCTINLKVNIPPKFGVVKVMPLRGKALFDDFNINITGEVD